MKLFAPHARKFSTYFMNYCLLIVLINRRAAIITFKSWGLPSISTVDEFASK